MRLISFAIVTNKYLERKPNKQTINLVLYGRIPEWPKGADCKSVVSDFGGSNPPSPTKKQSRIVYSVLLCDKI